MKLFNVVKLRKCENHRFVLGYFIINLLISHRWGKNNDCNKQQVVEHSLFVPVVCSLL
jgi:hypothetical protein